MALKFKTHKHMPGMQALMEFPNGYSASVIKGPYTYGGEKGLYELAVMHSGNIAYDTPITQDVLGYQTEEEIDSILGDIHNLPPRLNPPPSTRELLKDSRVLRRDKD